VDEVRSQEVSSQGQRKRYNQPMTETSVLFICLGNSCRSPMAESMVRSIGRGFITAYSAGLTPLGRIEAMTTSTLSELDYPTEGLWSKGLADVPLRSMDVVVSLIGPQGLQLLPVDLTARLEAWKIRDPYGDDAEVYLSVARTLETQIHRLVDDLRRETLT
jgi:arsenate reductase